MPQGQHGSQCINDYLKTYAIALYCHVSVIFSSECTRNRLLAGLRLDMMVLTAFHRLWLDLGEKNPETGNRHKGKGGTKVEGKEKEGGKGGGRRGERDKVLYRHFFLLSALPISYLVDFVQQE